MKVLHVIDSLGRGGAEQLLSTLLPELRRQGIDVGVLVRGGAMDLAPQIEASGITVRKLSARHRWNLIGMAREIALHAHREKVDVIHAHLYFPVVATALMQFLRLGQVRSCVTFHNLAYAGANRPTLALEMRRRLAAFLCQRSIDRCLGVSGEVAQHFRKAYSLREIEVLPNPVDVAALRKLVAGKPPSVVLDSLCSIVLPGRIVPEKGHADLIEALVILKEKGLTPAVIIAGDGPLRSNVEAQVRTLGLTDQVTFTGLQDHEALMTIIAGAEIVVVPSRFEGFGLTALEAMALGRAVVASRAGGLPETIGNAGILVPVADPAALAQALERLAHDPDLRARLGSEAVRRAATQFDLPAVSARLITIYAELLGAVQTDPNRK